MNHEWRNSGLSEYERDATLAALHEMEQRLRCPPDHRNPRSLIYRRVAEALECAEFYWRNPDFRVQPFPLPLPGNQPRAEHWHQANDEACRVDHSIINMKKSET